MFGEEIINQLPGNDAGQYRKRAWFDARRCSSITDPKCVRKPGAICCAPPIPGDSDHRRTRQGYKRLKFSTAALHGLAQGFTGATPVPPEITGAWTRKLVIMYQFHIRLFLFLKPVKSVTSFWSFNSDSSCQRLLSRVSLRCNAIGPGRVAPFSLTIWKWVLEQYTATLRAGPRAVESGLRATARRGRRYGDNQSLTALLSISGSAQTIAEKYSGFVF